MKKKFKKLVVCCIVMCLMVTIHGQQEALETENFL